MRKMTIEPRKCTGCTTCALTCSITYTDRFDLNSARIKVTKDDIQGTFWISFSSLCTGCCSCARVCPAGCLSVVETTEGSEGDA